MRLDTVRDYALAGVDAVSVGALTHSVAAADVSLELTRHERMSAESTDVLVLGTGVAGCTAALAAARDGAAVTIVTRADEARESNTLYAQGGIVRAARGRHAREARRRHRARGRRALLARSRAADRARRAGSRAVSS